MFNPRFTFKNQLLEIISDIERLSSIISFTSIPMELKTHIKWQCLVALTHYSTAIEGNELSLEQVSGVVEGQKTFGLLHDEHEVKNYFKLLEKIPNWKTTYHHIDLSLIQKCHFDLLDHIVSKENRGKFRSVQNAVYDSKSRKISYLPPEPKDVHPLTHDLCNWVNDTNEHPLVATAIFHNQFVTIHPFVDGNGRSARLFSLYLLKLKGYDWYNITPIDRYYADDRLSYYAMLQQSYSHNYYFGRHDTDFTNWIEYYCTGIKTILEGTFHQIELFKKQNILLNNRQSNILKFLETNAMITAFLYAKRFNISTRMATRDLTELVNLEKVIVIGKARATKYILK